ncbi:hypothetical protein F2Q70_00014651 [Brassica cretica]|uniref:Uncharacterized protein n=1 Tax=Brassica cretica TaxID=69181 RepID=A0A8S9L2X4_BRACR|nr:hypothetical protein F2Q70_00014651 [Brassica cretica]KAF2600472.1 hypothetical protein F2Q68_00007743 [Brassica cretica]
MASSASTHGGSAHGSFVGDDESALTQSDGEWVQHQALSSFPDTNRFIHHVRIYKYIRVLSRTSITFLL